MSSADWLTHLAELLNSLKCVRSQEEKRLKAIEEREAKEVARVEKQREREREKKEVS